MALRLRNGTRIEIGREHVLTILPDGREVLALPRPDQASIARELGYPDTIALTREHDPLHSMLCDWLGLPASFALRQAAGEKVDPAIAAHEEAAVLALQRFMRAAGVKLEDIRC